MVNNMKNFKNKRIEMLKKINFLKKKVGWSYENLGKTFLIHQKNSLKKLKTYWVGVEWGNNGLLSHRRNAEPVRFRPTQITALIAKENIKNFGF